MTKWLLTVLSLLLLVLQSRLWGSLDGIRDVLRLKSSIAVKQEEVNRLTVRNQKLDAEVQALKNFPESLEELARFELGMIKQNETFYLVSGTASTR